MLSKKQNIEKGIWQTTHLVCSRAEGVKYNAAKKWNLPAVSKDWLLCCLNAAEKLPVTNYLVTEGMKLQVFNLFSTISMFFEYVMVTKLFASNTKSNFFQM